MVTQVDVVGDVVVEVFGIFAPGTALKDAFVGGPHLPIVVQESVDAFAILIPIHIP